MSTPTPTTYSVQLRFGNDRRRRFQLTAPSSVVAAVRISVVRELAALLVKSGRTLEAPEAIQELMAGVEFDELAQGIRDLCAEPLTPPVVGRKTFRQLGEDWTSGRLAKDHRAHVTAKKSSGSDLQRLEVLYETIGDVALEDFTRQHAQQALAALPADLSLSTLRQYAQVIRRVLKLAAWPCGLIDASPLPENFCPKVNPQPKFVCIYPAEDALVMACRDVEFAERFLYGMAVRTSLRLASILDLTWRDVDHRTGYVRALCKDVKNAAGKILEFVLDPGTLRALKAWRETRHTEPATATIFPQWQRTTISKKLRASLLVAGVDRRELHESVTGTEPMRFHDLRASFVTFALANGQTEAWIMERTGHESSQMIARYKRDRYKQLELRDWLPLDQALGLTAAPATTAPATTAPAAALPLAVETQPSPEVEDLGKPLGAQDLGCPLPAPELPTQALDHVPSAMADGQGDQVVEHVLAQGGAGDRGVVTPPAAAPGAEPVGAARMVAQEALRAALGGVAQGVAQGFCVGPADGEQLSMISAVSSSGSTGTRTPDLRIKSSTFRNISQPLIDTSQHDAQHDDTNANTSQHDVPSGVPRVSSLSASMLRELIDLTQRAGCWRTLAALATDLAVLEETNATRGSVGLLVERRKQGGAA